MAGSAGLPGGNGVQWIWQYRQRNDNGSCIGLESTTQKNV